MVLQVFGISCGLQDLNSIMYRVFNFLLFPAIRSWVFFISADPPPPLIEGLQTQKLFKNWLSNDYMFSDIMPRYRRSLVLSYRHVKSVKQNFHNKGCRFQLFFIYCIDVEHHSPTSVCSRTLKLLLNKKWQ